MEHAGDEQPQEGSLRRLWTPWRMQYVGGGERESGCVFCNRLAANDDVKSLILHRARHAFAIMNLYPYNTGHVMLVPNEHVASPEDATPESLSDLARLLPRLLKATRTALACHGFNVGLNVGSVAGAGIADHMHQHIVPRWNGDANFMPIIASAMVMPELIPVTYAKLRAELERPELASEQQVSLAILDRELKRVIVDAGGRLPRFLPSSERAIAVSAVELTRALELRAVLAGWAGPTQANGSHEPALSLIATGTPGTGHRWLVVDESSHLSDADDLGIVKSALRHLAPAVGS